MSGVADEFLVRYAAECFASKSLVLGFFEQDTLRAAGDHPPDDDLTSDIAFSVEQEFRNRGIGTAMLRRLILSARNRKIQHLRMNCHGQNRAMQALARKFKADLRFARAETVGDIIPRAATPFSVWTEALETPASLGRPWSTFTGGCDCNPDKGTGRQVTADNRSITHVPLRDACFADGEDLLVRQRRGVAHRSSSPCRCCPSGIVRRPCRSHRRTCATTPRLRRSSSRASALRAVSWSWFVIR